jgi:hypothetical protein
VFKRRPLLALATSKDLSGDTLNSKSQDLENSQKFARFRKISQDFAKEITLQPSTPVPAPRGAASPLCVSEKVSVSQPRPIRKGSRDTLTRRITECRLLSIGALSSFAQSTGKQRRDWMQVVPSVKLDFLPNENDMQRTESSRSRSRNLELSIVLLAPYIGVRGYGLHHPAWPAK